MGHRPEETSYTLLRVFSQDILKSSSNELWQQMWNVCHASSTDTECSGFLSGAGHIGALCLAHKIPDSRRNAYMQHKTYCPDKQFRLSETFLSANGESPPEIQDPRCQPRDTLVVDLSKASSRSLALLFLFCTTHILLNFSHLFIYFVRILIFHWIYSSYFILKFLFISCNMWVYFCCLFFLLVLHRPWRFLLDAKHCI